MLGGRCPIPCGLERPRGVGLLSFMGLTPEGSMAQTAELRTAVKVLLRRETLERLDRYAASADVPRAVALRIVLERALDAARVPA